MNKLLFQDLTSNLNTHKLHLDPYKKHNRKIKMNYNDIPSWLEKIEELKKIEYEINENFYNIEIMYKEIEKLNKTDNVMYNMEESLCKLIETTEFKIKNKDKIFKKLNYERLEFKDKEQKIIGNILTKNNLENKNIQEKLFKLSKYLNIIMSKYDDNKDNEEKEIYGNHNQNQAQIIKNTNLQRNKRLRIEKIYKDTQTIMTMISSIEQQVYLQGEYIDRVDHNLGEAQNYLKKANDELYDIYQQYNNWAYRTQVFLLICIFIGCILIIIKWA